MLGIMDHDVDEGTIFLLYDGAFFFDSQSERASL